MAQTPPANGPIADQKDIPAASPRPETRASVPARVPTPPATPSEDLYTYEKCTLMLVMQLRPQQQENGPRSVLLSVQNGAGNKEDLPLYRLLSSEEELGGPLPPAIITLLEALRQDLPARRQRHEQRAAKKTAPSVATRAVQKPSGQTTPKDGALQKQKKPGTTAAPTSPPPVPTTTNPTPKEGLVFGGLFDDL